MRFAKYTGQESEDEKHRIQQPPPHILLTNYVMLELMLVRPQEHTFVDRTTTSLQFLVLDELHAYRGRQGADVALLIRRLRERCGNPQLLCMGTSATMVAGSATTPHERRQAVADFASKLFGVQVQPDHVIEETLRRITSVLAEISEEDRPLVRPGAIFYWNIGYHTSYSGQRTRTSIIRFRRLPAWTREEIEAAKREAERLGESIGWK